MRHSQAPMLICSSATWRKCPCLYCKGKCDKMFPLSWLWAANCFVGVLNGSSFPITALMGSIFNPPPPHSSFCPLQHCPPHPAPRKLPQAWQQRGAIRVTLSPVSIPINQRWNWIPVGIIKGAAPVPLITSNKALQVIGRALGTLAGDNKSLYTLSGREPYSDVLAKHWADVLTKTFPSCPFMMWGFPSISKQGVPNWRHRTFGDILSMAQSGSNKAAYEIFPEIKNLH